VPLKFDAKRGVIYLLQSNSEQITVFSPTSLTVLRSITLPDYAPDFDLSGLTTIQYAVYRQSEAGYFDWHNDYGRYRGDPGQEPRKVTMSLQLSDGASYEGCDLEVRAAWPTDVAPRQRGTLVAFRANTLHRVTPITRGVRKALVIWAAGPEFR